MAYFGRHIGCTGVLSLKGVAGRAHSVTEVYMPMNDHANTWMDARFLAPILFHI